MIEGVLFDMDGLMTDTERLFLEMWCQYMKEQGFPEHRDVVQHCIGLNHRDTRAYVAQRLGDDFDYLHIMEEVGKRSERYCRQHGVPVKPGLYTLLDYLDSVKIPYAVATSTGHKNAAWRLQNIGVLDRLSGLVTGDMVQNGKPNPEIFLKAADSLRLPAEKCLVLEDSPHGIQAAYSAGCSVVMVPDMKAPDKDIKALLTAELSSLDQVIPFLRRLRTL